MTLKPHPYDYINKDNFETIKNTISMGMAMNKSPVEIAQLLSQATGLDTKITMALIQAELKDTLQSLKDKDKKSKWRFLKR